MPDARATTAPAYLFWDPEDPGAREYFLGAHDTRHRTYRLAASRAGSALPPCPLTGPMDADWFARHMGCHLALKSLFPREIGELNVALEMPAAQDGLLSWMRRHALVHARLDAAFGVI